MIALSEQSVSPVATLAADAETSWRHTVEALRESSLGHCPEWFSVIREAYGHDPLYFTAESADGQGGVLPAFIVRRPLFGSVISSMPFLDTGGPCSSSASLVTALVDRLVSEARRLGAHSVELRCTDRLPLDCPPMEHKVSMTLALPTDADRLWKQLDANVRSKVRRAGRFGLSVEVGGVEQLPIFYDAFAMRMRDLGSPVHAPEFLQAVMNAFGSRARIVLVKKGSATVGGLVTLAFKDRLMAPWATCLKEYFALYPNMLLYWETIRMACAEGFRCFDFGRSTRHSGTYRFKSQWGAQEQPLFWYTIPIASHHHSSATTPGQGALLLSRAWQRLPLAVTRTLGPRIRKYLVQ